MELSKIILNIFFIILFLFVIAIPVSSLNKINITDNVKDTYKIYVNVTLTDYTEEYIY